MNICDSIIYLLLKTDRRIVKMVNCQQAEAFLSPKNFNIEYLASRRILLFAWLIIMNHFYAKHTAPFHLFNLKMCSLHKIFRKSQVKWFVEVWYSWSISFKSLTEKMGWRRRRTSINPWKSVWNFHYLEMWNFLKIIWQGEGL